MRRYSFYLLCALTTLLWPAPARAQQSHLNQARGFNSNQVYATHDVDSVNVFNGNLVMNIPVGGTYKVGGNLSYSLNLFYNSNLWTYSEVGGDGSIDLSYELFTVWITRYPNNTSGGGGCCYKGATYGVEGFIPNDTDGVRTRESDTFTVAHPNPAANAGMGWQFTLGKLYEPRWSVHTLDPAASDQSLWVYQSPDGSEHSFYPTLHADDPASRPDGDPSTDPVTYTRDGSYLRMKVLNERTRVIEFPDGVAHKFENLAPPPEGDVAFSPAWRVTEMADQFGNKLVIGYAFTRDASRRIDSEQWTLSDGHRVHRVHFARRAETPDYPPVMTSVDLAAFGGVRSVYNFEYEVHTLRRAWPNVEHSPVVNVNIQVPFLKAIKQPDSSWYSMSPVAESYDLTGDASSARSRGVLRRMTLPTGARVEWEYRPEVADPAGLNYGYAYPTMGTGRNYLRRSTGVRVRRVTEGGNTYTWRYDPQLEPQPAGCNYFSTEPECAHKLFKNKVTTPQGDYTTHYFSVYPFPTESDTGRTDEEWHVAEYGLPMNKDVRVELEDNPSPLADDKSVFLSTEVYASNGTKLRETYVRYETDKILAHDPWGGPVAHNRRLAATKTLFLDDDNDGGVKYVEETYSGFDGLGNYRIKTTEGNFASADFSLDQTDYNPSSGTYIVDPATNLQTGNYVPFAESLPWVLKTFSSKVQKQGPATAKQQFQFDQWGRLLRKRLLWQTAHDAIPATHARDVLVAYAYDASGNLLTEDYYGGDKRADLPTGPIAQLTLPGTSEHRITHTHQYGSLKKSLLRGDASPVYDADIDFSTGLVSTSRDGSGLPVEYSYDKMGRITQIKPGSGSRAVITYSPVTGGGFGGAAKVTVQHKSRDSETVLAEEGYEYDHLGRLKLEKKNMPGGKVIARRTLYNGQGWVLSRSEWNQSADGTTFPDNLFTNATSYLEYDPFGRAHRIVPPDDASGLNHDVRIEYIGVRKIRYKTQVATAFLSGKSYETEVVRLEGYDRQGRLGSVEEDSAGEAAAPVKTTYLYDVGQRLSKVSTTAPVSAPRTNVALASNGATVFTSQSYDVARFPPLAAVNGDRKGLGWGSGDGGWSDGTAGAFPDWLEVRFAAAKTINEIDVITAQTDMTKPVEPGAGLTFADNGMTDYKVQYWNGSAWVTVGQAVGNRHVWRKFTFAPVTTSRVRVECTGSFRNFSRVIELEAYEAGTPGAATQVTQEREFEYDNRGFLLSETHPELGEGTAAGGKINYNEYDSLGRVGSRRDGRNKLRYTYDAAGRLTLLRECLTEFSLCDAAGNWRALKEFAYYPTNLAGAPYRRGKVQAATRHNHIRNPNSPSLPADVQVTQTYEYGGVAGAVSRRELRTSTGLTFDQSFTYNELGRLETQTYPQCRGGFCVNTTTRAIAPERTVTYNYNNGELVNVPGYVNGTGIQYHPNGALKSLEHSNGVVDNFEMDPDHMLRPRQIYTTGAVSNWSSGIYQYDGAGNIKRIGGDWATYDAANRVTEATALGGATSPEKRRQRYAYDPFGNIQRKETIKNVGTPGGETTDVLTMQLDHKKNRLFGIPYDLSGNITGTPAAQNSITYDALNTVMHAPGADPGVGKITLYSADDERVWIWDRPSATSETVETVVLRGLGNEVLREYTLVGGNQGPNNWSWTKDYVHAAGKIVASLSPVSGKLDYHCDHLGTPRLITNAGKQRVAYHQYLPFGDEATLAGQDSERLKFTGHERDIPYQGTHGIPLDYMHARYYAPLQSRFLSVDPGRDFDPRRPQSWNLYSYVRNNPVGSSDPDGRGMVSWLANKYEAAATALENAGDAVEEFADNNTGPGVVGVVVNTAAGVAGDTLRSTGDAIRVGQESGTAVGSDAHSMDVTKAVLNDVGRASQIALTLAGPLEGTLRTAFATAPGKATFYSGGEKALAEAVASGGTRIEMTAGGKAINKAIGKWKHSRFTDEVWKFGSQYFARGARGTSNAYLHRPLRPGNSWQTVEKKMLDKRRANYVEHIVP